MYSGRRVYLEKAIQSQIYPSKILLPVGLRKKPTSRLFRSRADEKHDSFCIWTDLQGLLPREQTPTSLIGKPRRYHQVAMMKEEVTWRIAIV